MDKQQAKQRLPLFVPPPTTTTSLAFPSYLVRLSSFLSLRHLFSLYHGVYSGPGTDPAITASRHCSVFSFVGVFVFSYPLPSSRFFLEIGEEQSFSRRLIEEEWWARRHSIEFVESVVPFLLLFPSSLSSLDFSAFLFKSWMKMIFDLSLSTNTRQRLKKVKIWQ